MKSGGDKLIRAVVSDPYVIPTSGYHTRGPIVGISIVARHETDLFDHVLPPDRSPSRWIMDRGPSRMVMVRTFATAAAAYTTMQRGDSPMNHETDYLGPIIFAAAATAARGRSAIDDGRSVVDGMTRTILTVRAAAFQHDRRPVEDEVVGLAALGTAFHEVLVGYRDGMTRGIVGFETSCRTAVQRAAESRVFQAAVVVGAALATWQLRLVNTLSPAGFTLTAREPEGA